jgi:hypothetical protein
MTSMTIMAWHVLRRLPKPLIVVLFFLIVAVARASE